MSNNFSLNNQNNVLAPKENALPPVQYMLVALDGSKYGVRLDTLQEVVRYNQLSVAPVPNSPSWLDGITSLRGSILSVVSLRAFLGLKRESTSIAEATLLSLQIPGFGHTQPRLLVVSQADLTLGLVVDDILGVIFVQPDQIKSAENVSAFAHNSATPFLEGIYRDSETQQEIAFLNLRRLITSPQMLKFEPVKI